MCFASLESSVKMIKNADQILFLLITKYIFVEIIVGDVNLKSVNFVQILNNIIWMFLAFVNYVYYLIANIAFSIINMIMNKFNIMK